MRQATVKRLAERLIREGFKHYEDPKDNKEFLTKIINEELQLDAVESLGK